MANILSGIVESKIKEISALYQTLDAHVLQKKAEQMPKATVPELYVRLEKQRATATPFFITEFKRKSPSEGWIGQHTDLAEQVLGYARSGASAISVLTDEPFFGGNYDDLRGASDALKTAFGASSPARPLLLQKDFILDPIQVHLAKIHGADLILLIAAILSPEKLAALFDIATALGLGVLVEVHDAEELEAITHIPFPVLGINNRDLKTFRTALNRVNVFKNKGNTRFLISESSILDARHFQMVRQADGFLIGTSLMRTNWPVDARFEDYFKAKGKKLFKACGLRTRQDIHGVLEIEMAQPDFIGINFSPRSKRRMDLQELAGIENPLFWEKAVAVFYQNTESEIRDILQQFPFKTLQFYAGDQTPAFVRSLKQRMILAVRMTEDWSAVLAPYALDVDCFILDGAMPGSGQQIGIAIPNDFPYPFLLAGGIGAHNLDLAYQHPNCIGVDIASGIEMDGQVDVGIVARIGEKMLSYLL